jgi:hypothetical protein
VLGVLRVRAAARVGDHRRLERERLARVVGVRHREVEVEEGIERPVGADGERDAVARKRAERLILRAACRAEARVHPLRAVGEVRRVLDDDDAQAPCPRPEVGREPLGVLEPRAEPAPRRGRRERLHRLEHECDGAVADGVQDRLLARGKRFGQHRAQGVGREVELPGPRRSVGVRRAEQT